MQVILVYWGQKVKGGHWPMGLLLLKARLSFWSYDLQVVWFRGEWNGNCGAWLPTFSSTHTRGPSCKWVRFNGQLVWQPISLFHRNCASCWDKFVSRDNFHWGIDAKLGSVDLLRTHQKGSFTGKDSCLRDSWLNNLVGPINRLYKRLFLNIYGYLEYFVNVKIGKMSTLIFHY